MTIPRFLILAGGDATLRDALARRLAAKLGLVRCWQSGFALLLTRPETPCSTVPDGMIIGRCIGDPGRASLDDLVGRCWGNYVAVTSQGDEVTILRAPMGCLPVYWTQANGMALIAARAGDLLEASGIRPSIDWHAMAEHLAFPHLRGTATGLSGISELVPGERLHVTPAATHRTLAWSPWRFTAPEMAIPDPAIAAALVRDTAIRATAGLAGAHARPLLELSGGLDSSILAACLTRSNMQAFAINLVTSNGEGDERVHAGRVAGHCGLSLALRDVSDAVDLTMVDREGLARPGLPMLIRPADALLSEAAGSLGADAFVSGTGGDSVLCSPASAAPAADRLRREGVGTGFARTVIEIARLRNASAWRVTALAIRQALRPPLHRYWPQVPGFMAPDAIPAQPAAHPWFSEPDGLLPGRRSHVRSILAAMAHLDGYPRQRHRPSLFPLMSQPVVEACLRVPSWLQVANGRNRAVAREAFRSLLPAGHVDRGAKGGLDRFAMHAILANQAGLRAFLLDGALAAGGLVDRPRLEAYLCGGALPADERMFLLLPLIDAEAWARGWLSTRN
ncbi:asparagine synthase-related protein [Sphingomonas sp. CJ99]